MRIRTNVVLKPFGKVRARTTAKLAPMLPTLRTSATFSALPARKNKKRRTKKRR